MAYILKAIGDAPNILYKHFECDNTSDLSTIDVENVLTGSTCYVINTDTLYTLNSNNEWKIRSEGGNGGGSGGGEEWEIIVDTTLEEAVKSLGITTDSEGNAFSLKKMWIYTTLYSPSDTASGNITCTVNGVPSTQGVLFFIGTNAANGRTPAAYVDAVKLMVIKIMNGWTNAPNDITEMKISSHLGAKNVLGGKDTINRIDISAPTALEVGSKIVVWGVRA